MVEAATGTAQAKTMAMERTNRILVPSRFSSSPIRVPPTMISTTFTTVKPTVRPKTSQKVPLERMDW